MPNEKEETVSGVIQSVKKILVKIANWELPDTGEFWDAEKTRPTSYEAQYGSHGARDYIKSIAKQAVDILEETPCIPLINSVSGDTLREQFHKETGTKWENSQGEPDIDYVQWLELRIYNQYLLQSPVSRNPILEKELKTKLEVAENELVSFRKWVTELEEEIKKLKLMFNTEGLLRWVEEEIKICDKQLNNPITGSAMITYYENIKLYWQDSGKRLIKFLQPSVSLSEKEGKWFSFWDIEDAINQRQKHLYFCAQEKISPTDYKLWLKEYLVKAHPISHHQS